MMDDIPPGRGDDPERELAEKLAETYELEAEVIMPANPDMPHDHEWRGHPTWVVVAQDELGEVLRLVTCFEKSGVPIAVKIRPARQVTSQKFLKMTVPAARLVLLAVLGSANRAMENDGAPAIDYPEVRRALERLHDWDTFHEPGSKP